MIVDLGVYLAIFAITAFVAFLYQKTYSIVKIRGFSGRRDSWGTGMYCLMGCLFLLPIIAMFSLRYGIGTDYHSYEVIYDAINGVSFDEFTRLHYQGVRYYYVEFGYYFLNVLFPSYRSLLWAIGILIYSILLISIRGFFLKINISFAVFIYLCTQFIYSMNGMRFALAVCFILLGYVCLVNDEIKKFVICVLCATMFHQSSAFCLAMLLLKQYKRKDASSMRNIIFFLAILSFPFFSGVLLRFAGSLSFFERYFNTAQYLASETMSVGWRWMLHIAPVVVPLIFFCRKEIFDSEDTKTWFRICLAEIPSRMMALYNTWYTRYARCSQISQVIFIPLVLSRVEDRKKRKLLYAYYVVWYIFYFAYYAIVNDQGDSLPYVWIFSR